jgi:hypothetical protein
MGLAGVFFAVCLPLLFISYLVVFLDEREAKEPKVLKTA